jgi:hypothetical protein
MAHDQEVRRLVLLVMISSPVPTWSAACLAKVLRMHPPRVRAALADLVDKDWVCRVEERGRLLAIFSSSRYGVTARGFSDGLVDLLGKRPLSKNVDNASRLSPHSLSGFLPVTDDTEVIGVITTARTRTVQAPPMFALCGVRGEGSTEVLAWGMKFTYCVVLTSQSGTPLGRFPNPCGARRALARELGLDDDAIHLLWLPARGAARVDPSRSVRTAQLSRI